MLWMAIASIAIVAMSAILLSSLFSRYAVDEVSKVNGQEVRHTVGSVSYMLEKLRVNAIAMYDDPEIHAWIVSDKDDPIQYISAVERLTRLLSGEVYIQDAYLINRKKAQIYETGSGLHSFDAFGVDAVEDLIGQSQYLTLSQRDWKGERKLTMVVPSTPSRQTFTGYVVLTLDVKAFEASFLASDDPGVMIVLCGETTLPERTDSDVAATLTAMKDPDATSGSFRARLMNREWLVHYDSIPYQGWTFYRMWRMDEISHKSDTFRNRVAAALLGLLVLLVAAQSWNAKRSLKPLGDLASKVVGIVPQPGDVTAPFGEYALIEKGIDALQGRISLLDKSITEQKDVLRADAVRQWIQQGRLTASNRQFIDANLLALPGLRVGVMRMEAYQRVRAEWDFMALKQKKQAACEAVRQAFATAGFPAEAVDMGADNIVLIIGCAAPADDTPKRVLAQAQECAFEASNARFALAIGPFQRLDEDLRRASENIYELSMLKFIWGENRVYDEVDFEACMRATRVLPDDTLLDKLTACLRAGNAEAALLLFDAFTDPLRQMTYTNCKFYLTLCVYTLFTAFSGFVEPMDAGGVQGQLDAFDSMESAANWLRGQIAAIAQGVQSRRKTNKRSETALDIVEYIENNLSNPNMSQADIAEHVSLSVRTVGQVIKEALNETPSDYILKRRVETAMRLLITTDLPASELIADCGFISKSHFFTAFKKRTGLTPSQYRQAYRQERAERQPPHST
ncbi:MAG: AraC family transcriptional regulator [Oscillospiraceae bacterium]|nr:AraC family transcriptional regulator [Oscillospiraceae bacterium]